MTQQSRNNDSGARPDPGSPARTPRWVKVFGIVILVVVLLIVILHLTGNSLGGHMHQANDHGVQQP